jgi:hypothetical protein
VIWTGSDDGLVHVTRDGGAHWSAVTPPELPEWSQVNSVEPSPVRGGRVLPRRDALQARRRRAVLVQDPGLGPHVDAHRRGIDRAQFTRVVRADPVRRGLLFAGTERGVWVSLDDGGSWSSLQLELPIVPVTDLA